MRDVDAIFTRHIFEKALLHSIRTITERELLLMKGKEAKIKAFNEQISRCLVMELEVALAGKAIGRIDVQESWPEDWWQAVKQRWAPHWFLRRYPVRFKTVSVHQDLWRICPHLPTDNQHGPHLQFLTRGEDVDVTHLPAVLFTEIAEDIRDYILLNPGWRLDVAGMADIINKAVSSAARGA